LSFKKILLHERDSTALCYGAAASGKADFVFLRASRDNPTGRNSQVDDVAKEIRSFSTRICGGIFFNSSP